MKWVEKHPGTYAFVNDDDPRPAVDLPEKEGVPLIISKPPWAVSESQIHDPNLGGDKQFEAAEHFDEERKKWTGGGKWARWEKSRKERAAKDKPAWRKERMEQERRKDEKIIKDAIAEL